MFRRNLIYHIWPNNENDCWQWNVQHLLRYIDQFDGVRSIGVAVGHTTVTVDEVKQLFAGTRIDNWIETPNIPLLRECTTYIPLLKTLPRTQNDITFYGHAKGVRHKHNGFIPSVWAHVMYRICLAYPDRIEDALKHYPMTGAFKRHSEFRLPHHNIWHYSGTFFWFRNHDVFVNHADCWDKLHPRFFAAVEAWPARLYKAEETHCLFNEHHGDSLYDWFTWNRLLPELKSEFGIEVDIGPKPHPHWKPVIK